ncbi:MAG: hypothetical protein DI561_00700 [Thauera sp.]|nr:MAG: hypothetical protein DI561_00700 [Thauera sp.]
MSKFLSSVLKGITLSESLSNQRDEMKLRQQRADQEAEAFNLQKQSMQDAADRRQAEKDFAVDAMNIQGRIGKEGSADAGPPAPALSEPDALDLMAKSASRFGLSDRAFDLAAKAGIKRDQHRLMGAVLGGDLTPMFERLGSFGIKADEGQDPQTGKPFISITRKDGTTKLMPFDSRDHMLGSMASLLEGKYADFALNMAKSGMTQDTALQRMYMDSAYKFGNLNRQIAETNARIDGTYNGGRGTGAGGKRRSGSAANDEPGLYGEGIKSRDDLDKMLKARIPDDAPINLRHEGATDAVSPHEYRNRLADHLGALAQGAGGARAIEDLLPVAEELARREFVERQAGVQPPDGVFTRAPEYDPKAGTWRLKLVTPEGDSFYYGRPGADPSRFNLSPEKLAEAHLQKAGADYRGFVEIMRPENTAARQRLIREQFKGNPAAFEAAAAMALGRVRELQAEREAYAERRREASRAATAQAHRQSRQIDAGAPFSSDELAQAKSLGASPQFSMAEFFKEAVGGVVDAVGRGVDSNSRALFNRTLKSTRSRGRIDYIEAKDMARAIERLPALKTELTAQELNAIQVAIGRRIQ